MIVGNTLLYGATGGEVFVNGLAGERFAVRNSGATAVVEGVGDHGCEYMTSGLVVVLGRTGRNFAAGMSGGVAYVLDEHQLFDTLCNLDMVDLESIWQRQDERILHDLINRHHRWTGSRQAERILDNWPEMSGRFVKVMPIDYREALQRLREREAVVGVHECLEPFPGLPNAPGQTPPGQGPAENSLALQGPAGDGLPGETRVLQDSGGHGPGAGDKGDRRPVARLKFPGHGEAREEMAAGAPGGDDDSKVHEFRVSSFKFRESRCRIGGTG